MRVFKKKKYAEIEEYARVNFPELKIYNYVKFSTIIKEIKKEINKNFPKWI